MDILQQSCIRLLSVAVLIHNKKSAQIVAWEIGGQVAVADPLAANWLGNLREVASKFKAALK